MLCRLFTCIAVCIVLATGLPAYAQGRPDFSLPATTFQYEREQDEQGANEKYLGKVVQLRGKITRAPGRNIYNESFIFLDGVQCVTQDPQPWASFGPGQKVSIQGKCVPGLSGPVVYKGIVKPLTLNPTPNETASSLAKRFAAEENAAEKYNDKHFIVSGVVTKVSAPKSSAASVTLETEHKLPVVCTFDFTQREQIAEFQAGDTLKAFGQYNRVLSDEDAIELFFCQLIKPQEKSVPK